MKEKIEELRPLSKKEETMLKLRGFMKIRLASYAISAAAAIGAGSVTQSTVRKIDGYDPKAHAELKAAKEATKVGDFEKFREEKKVEEKKSLLSWAKGVVDKLKTTAENPEAYIKNNDMYKEVQMKYMNILELIDDTAFIAPALLTFIMLGGFLSRTLTSLQGDPVQKKKYEDIVSKMKELSDASNEMRSIIKQYGIDSLSREKIEATTTSLKEIKDLIPDPSEIEGLDNK